MMLFARFLNVFIFFFCCSSSMLCVTPTPPLHIAIKDKTLLVFLASHFIASTVDIEFLLNEVNFVFGNCFTFKNFP